MTLSISVGYNRRLSEVVKPFRHQAWIGNQKHGCLFLIIELSQPDQQTPIIQYQFYALLSLLKRYIRQMIYPDACIQIDHTSRTLAASKKPNFKNHGFRSYKDIKEKNTGT